MVELKAQIQDRESVRKLLLNNGGEYIGHYHQVDAYFTVPRGRLKIRELGGLKKAHLIFYEREDVRGPKESRVWKAQVPNPTDMKELLSQVLPICAIVDKDREIYMCNGIQVHLDKVENLGEFLEFEKEVPEEPKAIQQGRVDLQTLLKKLDISVQTLQKKSYCEMIIERQSKPEK